MEPSVQIFTITNTTSFKQVHHLYLTLLLSKELPGPCQLTVNHHTWLGPQKRKATHLGHVKFEKHPLPPTPAPGHPSSSLVHRWVWSWGICTQNGSLDFSKQVWWQGGWIETWFFTWWERASLGSKELGGMRVTDGSKNDATSVVWRAEIWCTVSWVGWVQKERQNWEPRANGIRKPGENYNTIPQTPLSFYATSLYKTLHMFHPVQTPPSFGSLSGLTQTYLPPLHASTIFFYPQYYVRFDPHRSFSSVLLWHLLKSAFCTKPRCVSTLLHCELLRTDTITFFFFY